MTGPEHYREAERLIERAHGIEPELPVSGTTIALAQVHATLALAAATAEPVVQAPAGPGDRSIQRAWSEAIS